MRYQEIKTNRNLLLRIMKYHENLTPVDISKKTIHVKHLSPHRKGIITAVNIDIIDTFKTIEVNITKIAND